ncbi:hypothetical protein [Ignavibacterium album]|uniref:hypothetical protein n=1 Tax=Ignavibacterium album TaxID=591197 RepID=UPI0026ECCE65|nr:hypothetical protein [Ignavibacterium album]
MKKIYLFPVLILFVIFLTGCLQLETKIYVNKDGSGTLEETVMFKDEVIEMMKQFIMAIDSTQSKDVNIFKEDDLISKAESYGEGVSYFSSEKLKSSGYEGATVKYNFTDISKLNLNLFSDEAVPGVSESDTPKNPEETLKFIFSRNNSESELKIYIPSMMESEQELPEEVNDSTFNEEYEKAKEMFADMKMSFRIIPAEKIKSTNADFVKDNEVTLLEMNMNGLLLKPELFKELSGNKINSLDEFRELIKNVEGFKIESKNEVQINF